MLRRFLIVEDDPIVALMIEGYLDLLNLEAVGVAGNIATSLQKVSELGFDAAIIDVHLADGETSAPIAEALNAANIPFIVTTGGFRSPPDPAYDNHPVLPKPFTMMAFEAAIAAIS